MVLVIEGIKWWSNHRYKAGYLISRFVEPKNQLEVSRLLILTGSVRKDITKNCVVGAVLYY
jgi:hypothetical protein